MNDEWEKVTTLNNVRLQDICKYEREWPWVKDDVFGNMILVMISRQCRGSVREDVASAREASQWVWGHRIISKNSHLRSGSTEAG